MRGSKPKDMQEAKIIATLVLLLVLWISAMLLVMAVICMQGEAILIFSLSTIIFGALFRQAINRFWM